MPVNRPYVQTLCMLRAACARRTHSGKPAFTWTAVTGAIPAALRCVLCTACGSIDRAVTASRMQAENPDRGLANRFFFSQPTGGSDRACVVIRYVKNRVKFRWFFVFLRGFLWPPLLSTGAKHGAFLKNRGDIAIFGQKIDILRENLSNVCGMFDQYESVLTCGKCMHTMYTVFHNAKNIFIPVWSILGDGRFKGPLLYIKLQSNVSV